MRASLQRCRRQALQAVCAGKANNCAGGVINKSMYVSLTGNAGVRIRTPPIGVNEPPCGVAGAVVFPFVGNGFVMRFCVDACVAGLEMLAR